MAKNFEIPKTIPAVSLPPHQVRELSETGIKMTGVLDQLFESWSGWPSDVHRQLHLLYGASLVAGTLGQHHRSDEVIEFDAEPSDAGVINVPARVIELLVCLETELMQLQSQARALVAIGHRLEMEMTPEYHQLQGISLQVFQTLEMLEKDVTFVAERGSTEASGGAEHAAAA